MSDSSNKGIIKDILHNKKKCINTWFYAFFTGDIFRDDVIVDYLKKNCELKLK